MLDESMSEQEHTRTNGEQSQRHMPNDRETDNEQTQLSPLPVENEQNQNEQSGPLPPEQVVTEPETRPQNIAEDFEAGVIAQLDSLYRTARRMTSSQQEAEDLVQETMLKAFRFANQYQRGTNLRAWLFRILNTSAINRYRKQATHPNPASLPEGEDFYLYNRIKDLSGQELNIAAEEEVLSHYLDEDVYNALQDLPPNFRMAVILADIEGLSYKEIAEALQIPIGTVMSRISRARRQLQHSLWEYAKDKGYVRAQAS